MIYGLAFGGGWYTGAQFTSQYYGASLLGCGMARYDLHWSHVEATQGVFDWSQPDLSMTTAVGFGLDVLCLIGAHNPTWAGGNGS